MHVEAIEVSNSPYHFDVQEHNKLIESKAKPEPDQVSTDSFSIIKNGFIEFSVEQSNGRYTIGSTGGNPNFTSDNYARLMYGHPSPWSSYTSINIDGNIHIFQASSTSVDSLNKQATSIMDIDGVIVTQKLRIINNPSTGNSDMVQINYSVQNLSGSDKNVGIRIMMDTMLGYNDGAPFKVPSIGNITHEKEMSGSSIPRYWQAIDSLVNPSVYAIGTLYSSGDLRPDKIQFTSWSNAYNGENSWNYTVNPDNAITNDSAVSIFWNQRKISSNGTLSVNTYYGVGLSTNVSTATKGNTNITGSGFVVKVFDEENKPIEGALVEVDAKKSILTNSAGEAVFSNMLMTTSVGFEPTIVIKKTGYYDQTVIREIKNGSFSAIHLQTSSVDDSSVKILGVTGTFDNKVTDLTYTVVHFKSDIEKTPPTTENSKEYVINIKTNKPSEVYKYQFLQAGEIIHESSSPSIPFIVLLGKNSTEFGNEMRIEKFKAGKIIYVRVVLLNGKISERIPLSLKVSEPIAYYNLPKEGSFKFINKITIPIRTDIPILKPLFGEGTLEIDFLPMKLEIEYFTEGKVRIAVNMTEEIDENVQDWEKNEAKWNEYKKDYLSSLEASKSSGLNSGGAIPKGFNVSKFKFKVDFIGYGEGYIDANKNINVDIGLIMRIKTSTSITQYTFAGWVPIYISLGAEFTVSSEVKGTVKFGPDGFDFRGALGEILGKVRINADGGVGVNEVVNVGVSGRATLEYLDRFTDHYQRVSLSGEFALTARLLIFKYENIIAKSTIVLYDSFAQSTSSSVASQESSIYDTTQYKLIPRDYLKYSLGADRYNDGTTISDLYSTSSILGNSNEENVMNSVFPNALPKLVESNGKSYLFWLQDISSRTSENRTALVYSFSSDNVIWSQPTQLIYETDSSTPDFNFDLSVDGDEIHIVWVKAKQQFSSEITLEEMAVASEIYTATLDTNTDSVHNIIQLTNNDNLETLPVIQTSNNDTTIAWVRNISNGGLFDLNSQTAVEYVQLSNPTTIHSRQVTPGTNVLSLDLGVINNELTIAYSLDMDSNYDTTEDMEIFTYSILDMLETRITNDISVDSNPTFVSVNNVDGLMWYSNGDLKYTSNLLDFSQIFGDYIPDNLSDRFVVVNDENGNSMILWSTLLEDEETGVVTSSVFSTKYENGVWSLPYKLSTINSKFTSEISGFISGDNVVLGYLGTNLNPDNVEINSLYVNQILPAADIELLDVLYEDSMVENEVMLPLTYVIRNRGNETVNQIDVYNDDTGFMSTITNASLAPGEIKEYIVDGFSPILSMSEPTPFVFRASTSGDSRVDNNSVETKMGYTDLGVSSELSVVEGKEWLSISLVNKSKIETGAILRIMSDEKDGALIFEKQIEKIPGNSSQAVLVDLGDIDVDKTELIYVQVISSSQETILEDNSDFEYLSVGREQKFYLSVDQTINGSSSIGTMGLFGQGEEVPISALPIDGYRFSYWETLSGGVINDILSSETSFVMPNNDVELVAHFELEVPEPLNSFTAKSNGYNSIILNWEVPDGVTGFEIYRSNSQDGNYEKIGISFLNRYIDRQLEFNSYYYYKVKTIRTIDATDYLSDLSEAVSAKTELSVVQQLNVTYASASSNSIEWLNVSGANGYEIFYSINTSTTFNLLNTTQSNSFIHNSLTMNTKYNYKIRAYRIVNSEKVYGLFGDVVSVTLLPLPPKNLGVVSTDYNSIHLSWDSVAGVSGYQVAYQVGSGNTFTQLPNTSLTSTTITNLLLGQICYFKVRTYQIIGGTYIYGPFTELGYGSPELSTPALMVNEIGSSSIDLNWAAVAGATGYELHRYNPVTDEFELYVDTQQLAATVSNLESGSSYYFILFAYRVVNEVRIYSNQSDVTVGITTNTYELGQSGNEAPEPLNPINDLSDSISFNSLTYSNEIVVNYVLLGKSIRLVFRKSLVSQCEYINGAPYCTLTDNANVFDSKEDIKLSIFNVHYQNEEVGL